jgi:hypothetical protein
MSLRPVLYQMREQLRSMLPTFPKTQMTNLAAMVVGMTYAENVRLPEIARRAPISRTQIDSRVQRFERLLDCPKFVPLEVLRPVATRVLRSLSRSKQPLVLVMDRTMIGDQDNLLMVSVACAGRCVPLGWVRVPHEGTSNLAQQQEVLTWVSGCLPTGVETWVVADREFHSIALVHWIATHLKWHVVARIQASTYVEVGGEVRQAKEMAERGRWVLYPEAIITKAAKARAWPKTLLTYWEQEQEEPWLLISDVEDEDTMERYYRQRFWTEEMFSDMKSRGLDLERTRITEPGRIERLLTALVLAYVWILQIGTMVVSQDRHRRVHNRGAERSLSLCQTGLRWLTEMLFQGFRVARFTAIISWVAGPGQTAPSG